MPNAIDSGFGWARRVVGAITLRQSMLEKPHKLASTEHRQRAIAVEFTLYCRELTLIFAPAW